MATPLYTPSMSRPDSMYHYANDAASPSHAIYSTLLLVVAGYGGGA